MTPGHAGPSRDDVSAPGLPPGADGPLRGGPGPGGRRGIRTVILSAVALVGLAGLAIGALVMSLGPPGGTTPGAGDVAGAPRTGTGSLPPDAEGPAVSGTISIAPELSVRLSEGDTLFIIARKGPGPPFAVKRIADARFPLQYRLGPGDVTGAGAPFEGDLELSARVSKTGSAGPAERGDLEGEHPGRVAVGARGVDIVITHVR